MMRGGGLAVGATNKLVWKVYVGVIGAVTTIVAQKLVTLAWKTVTGDEPPAPTDPETPAFTAVTWAVASGVGVTVAQLFAQRFAARQWAKETGLEAPGSKVKVKV
jgi:hypothetical protein